ncbi:MAG: CCA tRNA nucleotidyltransferase [Bacteroidota bacterium]
MKSQVKHIEIQEEILRRIGRIADAADIEAYAVGGYVRDKLLGKEVMDIDIVVLGESIPFAKRVARELRVKKVVTFEKFRTAMIHWNEHKLEFVGARKESYHRTSRKPTVTEGSLRDDLARRDFTINALAVSINAEKFGTLIDLFGGREDLDRCVLRTPLSPEKTFEDDPLRVMRAVRFASELGFAVERKTLCAVKSMRERITIVSQERITDELLRVLASPEPSIGFKLMIQTELLQLVFPEIAAMAGVEQREDHHHKDVLLHTLKVVDNIARLTNNLWLRFAALVHDIAKPSTKAFREGVGWTFHGHDELGARMVKGLFRRLRLPMEHLPYVEKLVRLHLRPMTLVDKSVTDSAVRRLLFEAGEDIDDLIMLCRADITSRNPRLVQQYTSNYNVVVKKINEVEKKDRLRNWQPPVRGEEIMQVCGLQPGPLVGKLKKMIEEAILDGKIPNEHDAALQYLKKVKDEVIEAQA